MNGLCKGPVIRRSKAHSSYKRRLVIRTRWVLGLTPRFSHCGIQGKHESCAGFSKVPRKLLMASQEQKVHTYTHMA